MSAIRSRLGSLAATATWSRGVSLTLRLGIHTRCLATATSPKADNRALDGSQDPAERQAYLDLGERRYFYAARAYEPLNLSYADILYQAIVPTLALVAKVNSQLDKALQQAALREPPDKLPIAGEPAQPEPDSQEIELDVDRSLTCLKWASKKIKTVSSAVSKDLSTGAIPTRDAVGFSALQNQHLGRWCAGLLAFQIERRRIESYLDAIQASTEKAAMMIAISASQFPNMPLDSIAATMTQVARQDQRELRDVVRKIIDNMREAKLEGKWQQVWKLERSLAVTAPAVMQATPLASAHHLMINKDAANISEISMARMARWENHYNILYNEDYVTRKRMNVVKHYWRVLKVEPHKKPWTGSAVEYMLESPKRAETERIVIRYDLASPASPLWPRTEEPLGPQVADSPGIWSWRVKSPPVRKSLNTPPGGGHRKKKKLLKLGAGQMLG